MTRTPTRKSRQARLGVCSLLSAIALPLISLAPRTSAQETSAQETSAQAIATEAFFSITVNSAADGAIRADDAITLREAIEIANGTLAVSALSAAEQRSVTARASNSVIQFDLPNAQTVIELETVLPALNQTGVVVDGTTQIGYDANRSATAEIAIPIPIVTIRPAADTPVFRGLTVSADGVVIRGLNLYGFNADSQITQSTPPADIFITHKPTPQNRASTLPFAGNSSSEPPKGVLIEQNWLGLTKEGSIPAISSSFGVSVFDSLGTTISRNRIEYHNGSGIITGRQADNLEISENILVGNGLAGMPDAIRMDGMVRDGLISSNLICGNDGSGIFLFKPQGAINIIDNDIRFNGQRLRRSAIYLMGSDHRVTGNSITNQKGSGVTVTAYGRGPNTQSHNNVITGNQFSSLEGLSIDLNARRDRSPQAFQRGDGPNPQRNSSNRRQDTGNSAVNAPQFASAEFFVVNGTAILKGQADPDSDVQLYRVIERPSQNNNVVSGYGPLSKVIGSTSADSEGRFEFTLGAEAVGQVFSAIATDSGYGTSEPARNVSIRALTGVSTDVEISSASPNTLSLNTSQPAPQCVTPPAPPQPPTEPTPPSIPNIPTPIRLEVPRNVHFGLDQDFISAASATVLDQVVDVLKRYPSIVVDLHGHTDSRASDDYNQDLARRRAENTRRYLLNKGIDAARMTIRSFGETELLVEETNVTNLARNRRVEFVFTDLQGAEIVFFDQEEDLQIER